MIQLHILRAICVTAVFCLAIFLVSCHQEATGPISALTGTDQHDQLKSTIERPISDFLGSRVGAMGWFDSENEEYWLYTDYVGYFDDMYDLGLGTTFEGKIIETPLDDGSAQVVITIRGNNVLTWVWRTGTPFELVFGNRPSQIYLYHLTPSLGSYEMKWEFINSAPGAPIPATASSGKITFVTNAFGELREAAGLGPDGTPGKAWTTQVGLIDGVRPNPPLDDAYPAEFVKISRIGSRAGAPK